jgi:hypothetical protein
MQKWNTMLQLKTKQNVKQSQPIQIRRGIFQVALSRHYSSVIVFISLTHELNRVDCGYQVYGAERKISHLLCMDDLKLLSRSEEDLEKETKIVKAISKALE